jgi:tRNA pseudouridine38-40 synthase
MEGLVRRFLLEVAYKGTRYSGFQRQENAITIQSELERALGVYFRRTFELTGSSRTDAGVHARQNYFHLDQTAITLEDMRRAVYGVNAILPEDIVWNWVWEVEGGFHARFDASYREYEYTVYQKKDPFLVGEGYYFPFRLDGDALKAAAEKLVAERDYGMFSKKHTQVKNHVCRIHKSEWEIDGDVLRYRVRGNRFLRGMVRGLVGTMLRVGRGKMDVRSWEQLLIGENEGVDFSAPAMGLSLIEVHYGDKLKK